MMNTTVKYLILANLAIVALLVFLLPHQMISPGRLIDGHQQLTTDCFACHAPLRGTPSAKCVSCHAVDKIGLTTTKGVPIQSKKTKTAFHQKLTDQNCAACHSDHEGVRKFRTEGRFAHALLAPSTRDQCEACHKKPVDTLHKQLTANCLQCHSTEKWKPATFEHDKFFVLDRDHTTQCVTCHARNDYKQYTCYGCHEHTPSNMRAEHAEENIRNLDNCVRCHRSSSDKGRGEGGERGEGDHGDREDDD